MMQLLTSRCPHTPDNKDDDEEEEERVRTLNSGRWIASDDLCFSLIEHKFNFLFPRIRFFFYRRAGEALPEESAQLCVLCGEGAGESVSVSFYLCVS